MAKKLLPSHPFMQKVDKLYEFMKAEGISISFNGSAGLRIRDDESNQEYRLRDLDSGQEEPEFPTFAEFKLTFDE